MHTQNTHFSPNAGHTHTQTNKPHTHTEKKGLNTHSMIPLANLYKNLHLNQLQMYTKSRIFTKANNDFLRSFVMLLFCM